MILPAITRDDVIWATTSMDIFDACDRFSENNAEVFELLRDQLGMDVLTGAALLYVILEHKLLRQGEALVESAR